MTNKELLSWCKEHLSENEIFDFPDEIFINLTEDNIKILKEKFGSKYLMKIPDSEIQFFEWLKLNDTPVWNDLWENTENNYTVALNFIPLLKNNIRGFPICDLLNNDNFYFTESHLISEEAKIMVESVQKMYYEHKQLTIEQALVLEISLEPIDIWRFAYRYKISIERAKEAVANLVNDKILIHLKNAEQLTPFIDF